MNPVSKIEWDEEKAEVNFRKHGITFGLAATVFEDDNSVTIGDTEHSDTEERYIDIGYAENGTLLIVVYTERAEKTRIISSRRATKAERRVYERASY